MKFPAIKGFNEEAFNKYLKNTGLLMIGRVGSMGIKMVSTIFVANHLFKHNFGILTNSFNYVFLFAAIAGLGLDSFVVKELHQFPDKRDHILGTAFKMKLLAGILCVPLICLAWQIHPLNDIPFLFIFILSFTGVFQSFTIIDSYFQSEVQSKYIAQVQIIGNIVSAGIKLGLIFIWDANLIAFIIALLGDVILLSLGYILVYARKGRKLSLWKYDSALAKKLLHFSWPLIISGLMVSVYMKLDTLMINEILGDDGPAQAGAYATVVMFSEALNFVPVAIVSSLFPAILNAKRDDPGRYLKRLQNLFDIMVWLSLSFSILISLFAPYIYFLFKPAYQYAANTLVVHVWGSIFLFLGVASSQMLIAEGWSKLTFIRTGTGAIVNIILNLLLIPKYGILGASIGTVAAYFVSAFFIILIPKTRIHGIMMFKSLFLITLFQKFKKIE
ncbi:MAG: flippase [Pedobacter sp.]|nr:MAG: flippase [Pedobacter sp.]